MAVSFCGMMTLNAGLKSRSSILLMSVLLLQECIEERRKWHPRGNWNGPNVGGSVEILCFLTRKYLFSDETQGLFGTRESRSMMRLRLFIAKCRKNAC